MRWPGSVEEGEQTCDCPAGGPDNPNGPHTVKEHYEASCGGLGRGDPCGGCYDCICAQIAHGERLHLQHLVAVTKAVDASRVEWMRRINQMEANGNLDAVEWPIEFVIQTPAGEALAMIFAPEDNVARMVVRYPLLLDRITITVEAGPPPIDDRLKADLMKAAPKLSEEQADELLAMADAAGTRMRDERIEAKQRALPPWRPQGW